MNLRSLLAVLLFVGSVNQAAAQIRPEEGRPQILWQDARPLIGKMAVVAGKVINVNTAGSVTFVNFDDQRPARFTAVIFERDLTNFPIPPKEMYAGKIVQVSGTISVFKDQPQIVVTTPAQLWRPQARRHQLARPLPRRIRVQRSAPRP